MNFSVSSTQVQYTHPCTHDIFTMVYDNHDVNCIKLISYEIYNSKKIQVSTRRVLRTCINIRVFNRSSNVVPLNHDHSHRDKVLGWGHWNHWKSLHQRNPSDSVHAMSTQGNQKSVVPSWLQIVSP